jgi:serine/threonine protein kinase
MIILSGIAVVGQVYQSVNSLVDRGIREQDRQAVILKVLKQETNIIHKDISPSNIVYNPKTAPLKIIDFGSYTQLTRENLTRKNPQILAGTLAYISPEQTGRMNRVLD